MGEHIRVAVLLFVLVSMIPRNLLAYIGPGAGLSAIGSLLAVLVALLAAVFGFVWYPLRRILRKRKHRKQAEEVSTGA